MAELNIGATTTPTVITDYIIENQSTEGASGQGETRYFNSDWTKNYGLYLSTNKIKASLKSWATWVVGLGRKEENSVLDNITGWGKDNFDEILWNMLIVKKVNKGGSYAEIIRNAKGTLINLLPKDPVSIVHVVNSSGVLTHYEQISKFKGNKPKKIMPKDMFHLVNDRVADNITGDSIIESLIWNIEAQEEARRAHRRMIKRNGIVRVIEVDTDDLTKIAAFKLQWKDAIEKGDVLILPKNVAEAKDWHGQLDTAGVLAWLNYLDDEYYQMIGLPKIIGGASGEIEGDSKVSYLAFEPNYKRALRSLTQSFWNQLAIRIDFNLPPSLNKEILGNEQKNASQTGFQPNDTTAGEGV